MLMNFSVAINNLLAQQIGYHAVNITMGRFFIIQKRATEKQIIIDEK